MGLLATVAPRPLASQNALSLGSFTQTCPEFPFHPPHPPAQADCFLLSQRNLVQSCGLPKSLKITGKSQIITLAPDFCTELQTFISICCWHSAGCLMITVTTAQAVTRARSCFSDIPESVPTLEPSRSATPFPRHCAHPCPAFLTLCSMRSLLSMPFSVALSQPLHPKVPTAPTWFCLPALIV